MRTSGYPILIFAETPDAVGFTQQFREQFDALLQELSSASADGKTPEFHIFRQTRDFQQIPESVPLIKTSRFFGHLSNLYSIIFHHLGGEARVTAVKEGGTDVYIRSCIRTLFLKAKQVRADLWISCVCLSDSLCKAISTFLARKWFLFYTPSKRGNSHANTLLTRPFPVCDSVCPYLHVHVYACLQV